MTAWSDPPRLLEGTTLSDEDRHALSTYASEAPGAERRARMLEGIARELDPSFDGSSLAREGSVEAALAREGRVDAHSLARERSLDRVGAGSAVRSGASKLKLVLVSAGLVVSTIGLLMLWRPRAAEPLPRSQSAAERLPTPSSVPAAPAVVRTAAAPGVESEQLGAALPEPSVAAAPAQAPADQRERPKPKRRHGTPPAAESVARRAYELPKEFDTASHDRGSDPVAELTLLARARRALLVRPAHALEFTEAHARDFPHGTFGEEREVLAIEALLRLGLDDEAKQRAAAFEQHFPNSAHRVHLARMIHPPVDP